MRWYKWRDQGERRVALIEGEQLRLLDPRECKKIYSLAMKSAQQARSLKFQRARDRWKRAA
jgi:hypothetical protein